MKHRMPHWRDDQETRVRADQRRALDHERTNGHPKFSWRRRAIAGVVIGLLGYLITSCYFAERLDRPKIERPQFRFNHQPYL